MMKVAGSDASRRITVQTKKKKTFGFLGSTNLGFAVTSPHGVDSTRQTTSHEYEK